ncbi:hypothetical protein V1509DRAFT_628781 [Lipomyces kononenkoae]
MFSQVIRFTLPPTLTISTPAFLELRRQAAAAGATAQYYGYSIPTGAPLPKKRHEICWAINWPETSDRNSITSDLDNLSTGDATSLLFQFTDEQSSNLEKALDAPVCEFACIRLTDDAPLFDAALQRSMHKTYLDTYKLLGFTGGTWEYAINTNETSGVPCNIPQEKLVPQAERRLAVYPLGWESIELHQDGSKTAIFAEEMDKLSPYFGRGSGAWYVMFRKHQ